jgi:hypothetical protein
MCTIANEFRDVVPIPGLHISSDSIQENLFIFKILNRLLKNRSDGCRAMQIHYRKQARDAEPTNASQVAYTLKTPLDSSTVSLRVPEIGSSTAC